MLRFSHVPRAFALVAGAVLATTVGSWIPAGASTSAPGVTAHTITIGLITPSTGPASSEYAAVVPAVEARFDLQNAKGGVDGRKIKLITEDTKTSPPTNTTASESLVSKGVFAVIDASPFAIGGYKVLQQAGMPTVGGGTGEPIWYEQPDTNMFAFDQLTPHFPATTVLGDFFKSLGATKIADFGYSTPSSSGAAKSSAAGIKKQGLTTCYLNTSITFGSVDAAPIALSMKSAGCTGAYMAMDANTNFAILTAAKQAGVPLKAAVSATGYGQTLLNTSAAVAAGQGTYFPATGVPVELHTKATKAFQAALAKYAHFTGVPSYPYYVGYMDADLMITGLEAAGKHPTRTSFIKNLRKVSKWTATGLAPSPDNFTLKAFGKAPAKECEYFTELKGKAFVLVPSTGKPTCGTIIPGTTANP